MEDQTVSTTQGRENAASGIKNFHSQTSTIIYTKIETVHINEGNRLTFEHVSDRLLVGNVCSSG